MSVLQWDEIGSRTYETGVDRGVFYDQNGSGFAWNGLTSVVEHTDSGSDTTENYFDGLKYRIRRTPASYAATITAVTYPDEFLEYDGFAEGWSQQQRKAFGLSYRTKVGDDAEGLDSGYLIHMVWNAVATPLDSTHNTIGQSVDLGAFSWDISTTPITIPGVAVTAHLVVDSRKAYPEALAAIENTLYGTDTANPTLPAPKDVLDIFESMSTLQVTVNGDGTFTVKGPDTVVYMLSDTEFAIDYPTAVFIDSVSYTVSSG